LEEAMQNVTQVYHCAAIVSFNPKQKNELHKTNIEGTANVVNACLNAQVQKLLFVSSVAALGRIREDKPIDETMNWTEETSNSEYGKTKFLAEMEVWRGIGEGLNAVIVNPTIILGNGDWNKGSSSVFKSVYNEFPWYTEGTTGFVDVLDVVEAMIQLMNSNIVAQRFILSAETSTYKDLFTLIANAFNKKPPSKLVTPFIAAVVWRLEAFKAKFSGKQPLLTKETAKTAQAKVSFNNQKLLQYLPSFSYTSLPTSIQRICKELKQTHGL
jgi:nucleoside-diphosphate-sugar epimerase